MRRAKLVVGGGIVLLAMVAATVSFQKSLTPYVSFAEARTAGRVVQVKGVPDHAGARLDPGLKAFCFTMSEPAGGVMDVVYRGPKPGNFEQAESVVAIGRYHAGVLEAEQILVKCPSKYEAAAPGPRPAGHGGASPGAPVPLPDGMRLPAATDSAAGT